MHLGGQDFNLAPKFPQMGDFGRQIDENFPTRRFSDIFLTAQNLIGGELPAPLPACTTPLKASDDGIITKNYILDLSISEGWKAELTLALVIYPDNLSVRRQSPIQVVY